ncbi:uncharacterized protein [Clytia hemisphaerica]|uniref:Uncharacterized protein n=1 Tax=Clytia hemisphaerica TaxID=252671 RepID=A0A7M5X4X0_9CNID
MDTMIKLQKSKQNIARLSKELEILKIKHTIASNDCLAKESKIRHYKKENADLCVKLAKEKAVNASLKRIPKPKQIVKSPQLIVESKGTSEVVFKSRDWRLNDASQKITVVREVCGGPEPIQKQLSSQNKFQPKSKLLIPKPVQMNGYLFVPAEYVQYMPGFGSLEVPKVKCSQDFRLNSAKSQEKINRKIIKPIKKEAPVNNSYESQLVDTPALPITVAKPSCVKIDSVDWADFEYNDDQKIDYNEIIQF